MRVLVLFHSIYGHVYSLAQAEAEGASRVEGVDVMLRRVPELIPDDVLEKIGALAFQRQLREEVDEAVIDDLMEADAILFGTGTRFGNMTGQMRSFLDQTGGLWQAGSLIGKVGSVFTCSATQHGGQESTILSFLPTLLHHGMVIAGLPYSFRGQMTLEEISGCSPYGASTMSGGDGARQPTANELAGAEFQGRHVAEIALKLVSDLRPG